MTDPNLLAFLRQEIATVEDHHPFASCSCCGPDYPAKHLPCPPVVCAQWLRRIIDDVLPALRAGAA